MQQLQEPTLPEVLPQLRDDIKLEEGGIDFNGRPTWVIQDLSNNHFFHIGWQEYEILSRWKLCKSIDLLQELEKDSLADISEQTLIDFILFLSQNFLIEQPFQLMQEKNNAKIDKQKNIHWFIRLAKTYLFFRIPLIKPNNLLNKSYPYFSWLFKNSFATFMLPFFLLTLVVLSQSWNDYHTTFFQISGVSFFAFYFVSLGIAKIAHEFGHAFACKKYNLNVPSMGVAFLVMFPMLYTDTSESWKIREPKARIIVPLAGVWVEFCLAIAAFWIWLFLPDGSFKSVCFFLSSYSLLTTLLINISPFLRFDGYHVLSDLLGMRNLQTRAFALTNWWLREKLFKFNIDPPEYFTNHKLKILLVYAFATWLYRFILFMGIALLVYYMFFKVLGIILFIIEIIYFILAPIASEIAVWWKMRNLMTVNRNSITSASLGLLILFLLIFPWQTTISLPATLSLKNKVIFTKESAQVRQVYVQKGQKVKKNQPLVKLFSPQITYQLDRNQLEINKIKWKLRNIATFQGKLSETQLLKKQIKKLKSLRLFLLKKDNELLLKAPFSGEVSHLVKTLKTGTWLSKNQALMVIISPEHTVIEALANLEAFNLLTKNQSGLFIPEPLSEQEIPLTVSKIANGSLTELGRQQQQKSHAYIGNLPSVDVYNTSALSGDINVRPGSKAAYEPEENLYKIFLMPEKSAPIGIAHATRGTAKITVAHHSYLMRFLKKLTVIVIKELNF